ncbi:MAG: molybdopterin-synthase adenylyltransferase MoeB [gamma proteobacterium symbiont of Ctena orbiculata]|uniref:Molybdopterin-synthase adenylyltransferase n=1 Tax=Candidatus Thiodiazotropha taylori TaxID=2792791 RepID=A0A944ME06_9GAMM|nr:molybdopterin-synthase adenylyltransferase MoeB [Candidatus Thiodiazotropha taylori]PUB87262.1 MAG: molybdopterin-synthase adenylyltransferase MoeB [gamma proteobacterium symbiont of Ctena orbiculata]MBT2989280.1 molybdopterin-synthase adenylyltransferase MoeB [Candidatus Thiodiazotropha taylori]MBT2995511.1 molybdopterin-synthase adenylyltransferase MoeB [Candidatus Thiodiazotropha taylori]MBT3025769.1 molybdopterin-synthase adenylyltransferase MoeB [Candidatus Thiodiazotropha taylori]
MNDDQLLRYSRQIMLPSIGIEGQERLLESRVLIVGLGGLGSPAAMYLAAAGVGTLVLVDFDQVDLTNLQRQIVHTTARIGDPKVESARETLLALNPECRVETIPRQLDEAALLEQIKKADLVLDGTDNFATRFAINKACYSSGTPLVSGAAIRMEGQITVFTGEPGGPCYHCLYPDEGEMDETCSANGVLAPLVGVIGSLQAIEAIKQLTGAGKTLRGRLLLLDALEMEWRSLRLAPDPACPVCGSRD